MSPQQLIQAWQAMAVELGKKATRLRKRGKHHLAAACDLQAATFSGCVQQLLETLRGTP